jgi:acyl-CoA reductase-like NAD-dependent aldehyde dehydrogenase
MHRGPTSPLTDDLTSSLIINGKKVSTKEGVSVLNPANEQAVARAPRASPDDLNAAVNAARAAFSNWASTPWTDRARIVNSLGSLFEKHTEPLATLLTKESGKPLSNA